MLMGNSRNMSVEEELLNFVLNGEIEKSVALIKSMNVGIMHEKIQNILLKVAFEKESIIPYVIVVKLLLEKERSDLHAFASTLLSNPLCWIEGAYQAGFYHQKRAVQMEPYNITYKEYLLSYNALPDEILSDEEALKIRKEIISLEPNNEFIKNYFSAKRFAEVIE